MKINPAPLVSSIEELKFQLKRIETYTNEVDIDIVDWPFTKNKTISVQDVLDQQTSLVLNFDLMMDDPSIYFDKLLEDDRVQNIIINLRSLKNILNSLDTLFASSKNIGMSINPENTISEVEPYLDKLEIIQIYTVEPGVQGNPFLEDRLRLVNDLRELGFVDVISIDGGINYNTIEKVKNCPVDLLSVGSLLCKSDFPDRTYKELIEMVKQ